MMTMSTCTIKEATLKDLKDLIHLERECFDMDRWPVWDLISVLTTSGIVRLKAMDAEGNMQGFIAGDIRDSKRVGWIITLGVFPKYRRMKVASTLLDTCENRLQRDCFKLCVRRSNQAAINLYLKHGYQKVDEWIDYYNDVEDAIVMEKRLT
ncbi:MAG: N-acetyltransferase [Anaerolineaceae bacterium]